MKPQTDISDPAVIKALTHPLRISILNSLEERVASPSELADELGAPLGNVSYHVRQLAALGLIKLVKKTPRRGAIEHHYKAVARAPITDEAWAGTPEVVKEAVLGSTLTQIAAAVNGAAAGGGFSRPDVTVVREEMQLDDKGFSDLAKELNKTLTRVRKISADATKRMGTKASDGARTANAVLMLFDSAGEKAAATASNGSKSAGTRRKRAKSRS
jgi:DNA-binding transcriptional ArsR family regulator